jgi:hypothetical protein
MVARMVVDEMRVVHSGPRLAMLGRPGPWSGTSEPHEGDDACNEDEAEQQTEGEGGGGTHRRGG